MPWVLITCNAHQEFGLLLVILTLLLCPNVLPQLSSLFSRRKKFERRRTKFSNGMTKFSIVCQISIAKFIMYNEHI